MGKYKVIAGQNLYDIALHIYGSIEGIVDLMMCNTDLSLDTTLKVGDELIYSDDFIINADVVAYNEMHGIVPSNGQLLRLDTHRSQCRDRCVGSASWRG